MRHTSYIEEIVNHFAESIGIEKFAFAVSSRFFRISDYLGSELRDRLSGSSRESRKVLSTVRLALTENVNPMSLHIAVVRIGLINSNVLVDIICDTTDSDRNHPIFAHVAYVEVMADAIRLLESATNVRFGVCVRAY